MSRNIFSLEAFHDWLRKQPAGKGYIYELANLCPIYQYFRQSGLRVLRVGSCTWTRRVSWLFFESEKTERLPAGFDDIVCRHPRTFGAAAERAREILEREAVNESR